MKRIMAVLGLGLMMPTLAQAQTAAGATAAPDPGRVAAARTLIDILLPPATREGMIRGMMAPMLANIQRGMTSNPEFAKLFASDPRARALFDKFMQKQTDRTVAQMATALPGMLTAMTNAYARRFDLQQLRELQVFFETPTGRAYMQASYTIMNDPDVAAWQQSLIAQSMNHIQEDAAEFATDMAALRSGGDKP